MQEFLNSLKTVGTKGIIDLIIALFVLIVGWKLSGLLVKLLKKGRAFSKADPIFRSFTSSFVSILLKATVSVTSAAIMGVPMATIVAVVSSAGLAVGLALQGSLSNFAGGLMILLFKPFEIGDYIEVNGSGGSVTDISVFYTTLLTPDNRVITLPNGNVSNNSVINYSKLPTRRMDIPFCLDAANDAGKVREIMLGCAKANQMVLPDPEAQAVITAQTEVSVTYTLRIWCKSEDYWTVIYDLTEQVKNAFDENSIDAPARRITIDREENSK